MDYKRAIVASLITYGITFALSIIVAWVGLGFEQESENISDTTWVFGGMTAILATVMGSYWYFKKKGINATVNTGFHLGLVMIVTSFILDWLAFLPMILTDPQGMRLINAYYGDPRFWVIVILVIGAATLTGKYNDRFTQPSKKSKKSK